MEKKSKKNRLVVLPLHKFKILISIFFLFIFWLLFYVFATIEILGKRIFEWICVNFFVVLEIYLFNLRKIP